MFEAEAIVGFMAGFLVVVAIFIEVPSERYGIRHGCGVCFLGEVSVCWGIMALTFTGLCSLVVVPIFLVGGLLSLFSNYPLLRASSILFPQSHNSPNKLIGDDKSLLL